MKKSFFSFILPCAMMLGAMTGCNESNNEIPDSLTINPKTLAFNREAANKNFGIESNAYWIITCSDTWLSCTPVKGVGNCEVKLSVSSNGILPRTGTVTVKTKEGKEETIQVTQEGGHYIYINPEKAEADPEGEDITVTIEASAAWTALIENGVDWISEQSKTDTQVVYTVDPNPSSVRSATITFTIDGTTVSKIFEIEQMKVGEWINVTELVGLKNTKLPFKEEGGVVNNLWGGYYKAQDWTANESAAANGNIELGSGKLIIFTYNVGSYTPSLQIINGHIYQTIPLGKGLYRLDTFCTDFFTTDGQKWMYFGAALGNDLPDIAGNPPNNPESKMLGCVHLTGGGAYSCNFEVPEGGATVSLGFIAHFLDGSQIYAFNKVELWKYE